VAVLLLLFSRFRVFRAFASFALSLSLLVLVLVLVSPFLSPLSLLFWCSELPNKRDLGL